jgi:hypothetical protein
MPVSWEEKKRRISEMKRELQKRRESRESDRTNVRSRFAFYMLLYLIPMGTIGEILILRFPSRLHGAGVALGALTIGLAALFARITVKKIYRKEFKE